jgi:hypothetical protein
MYQGQMETLMQGVTKRCRLSWLTDSSLVYKPKCRGGWLRGLSCVHGAQIIFGDLTPYLTYALMAHCLRGILDLLFCSKRYKHLFLK